MRVVRSTRRRTLFFPSSQTWENEGTVTTQRQKKKDQEQETTLKKKKNREESFFCDERRLKMREVKFFERREIEKSQGETQHTAQNGEVLLKIAREKRQKNSMHRNWWILKILYYIQRDRAAICARFLLFLCTFYYELDSDLPPIHDNLNDDHLLDQSVSLSELNPANGFPK